MALTFPLSLADFADQLGISQVKWLLQDNRELSGMGSGQILQADLGPALWQGDVTLREWYHDDARRIEAKANAMVRSKGSFYLYDPRKRFPAAYPNLDWPGNILAAAYAVADYFVVPNSVLAFDMSAGSVEFRGKAVAGQDFITFGQFDSGSFNQPGTFRFAVDSTGAGFYVQEPGGAVYTVLASATVDVHQPVVARFFWDGKTIGCSINGSTPATYTMSVPASSFGFSRFVIGAGSWFDDFSADIDSVTASPAPKLSLTSVRIASLPDSKSMTLKGLPANFVLSAGDYLSFDYSTPSRRAFHEVSEDMTAGVDGVTPAFEVSPFIRPGAVVDLAVTLIKPAMKCIIRPGSLDVGSTGNVVTTQIGFSVVQKL